jgi:hypothetical protein
MAAPYRYPTIKPVTGYYASFSESNQAQLQKLFGGHPGNPGGDYAGPDGEALYRKMGLTLLLKGVENNNPVTGRVDKDYGTNPGTANDLRPPTYAEVVISSAAGAIPGSPASPWVPNPTSPGPGNSLPTGGPAPVGYGYIATNTINPIPPVMRDPLLKSRLMSMGEEDYDSEQGKSPGSKLPLT